ncbi:hypothetical protein MTO96_018957 [Rhipicephalus appendiculatus]
MAAATETTAAAKDKGAVKTSRLAAVRTSQTKAPWPVRPTSAAKSASTVVEAKNDTLQARLRQALWHLLAGSDGHESVSEFGDLTNVRLSGGRDAYPHGRGQSLEEKLLHQATVEARCAAR